MGNYLQKVSYSDETQLPHAGRETIREGFPIQLKHRSFMPDGKLFTKSFLLN
jgi:hypothetical protein